MRVPDRHLTVTEIETGIWLQFGSEGCFTEGIRVVFAAVEITGLGGKGGLWNRCYLRSKGTRS